MASLNLLNIFLVLAAIKFTAAVLFEELYSFGRNVDDSKFSQVDDGYVRISLSSGFAFFDSRYSIIIVSLFNFFVSKSIYLLFPDRSTIMELFQAHMFILASTALVFFLLQCL